MINLSAEGGHFESASCREDGCRALGGARERTSSVLVLMGRRRRNGVHAGRLLHLLALKLLNGAKTFF